MIEISHVTKKLGNKTVLEDIDIQIPAKTIYGLIGYNGAGKTTLLKIINGIYRADSGTVKIDGADVYENESIKKKFFLMTEELFFLPQANLLDMERFYKGYYERWNPEVFRKLAALFGLDTRSKISGFSKGMKRQAGLASAFAAGPEFLLLDEAFDGLDPSVREITGELTRLYVRDREATIILTSHNLRELEERADMFGMIREGKLLGNLSGACLQEAGQSLEEYFLGEREERPDDWKEIFREKSVSS